MSPFRNILWLSVGDFVAKTLYFLAFIHLARLLGVADYGSLEFAIAILMYLSLLGDGGLELWATRQAAQVRDLRLLVGRVIPLRLLLAVVAYSVLLLLLPVFPEYPGLRAMLMLFGLTLFTQAVNLKWVFLGQEHMTRVATGLAITQIVFALAVFGCVRDPARMTWVPVLRLAGDLAMVGYFGWLFAVTHGDLRLPLTLRGARHVLRPALTMGAVHGLGLMSYNFDSVLLGFLLGPTAVGWYNAAYKPVTVALAMPVTYYVGLFPTLARAYTESQASFREVVVRSLRLTSIFAVPLGIGGTFLAEPIIGLLFGPAYVNSVPALRVLSWSAVLVILRGTYKHALNAAGRPWLELRCAASSMALNVGLNLWLIPAYGLVGAAVATLTAEMLWLAMVEHYCCRYLTPVRLLPFLWRPATAALAMSGCLLLTHPLFWVSRACISVLVYLGTLWLLDATDVRWRVWTRMWPTA